MEEMEQIKNFAFTVYNERKKAYEENQRQRKLEVAQFAASISSKIFAIFQNDSRIQRISINNDNLEIGVSYTKDIRADFISTTSTNNEKVIALAKQIQNTRGILALASPNLITGKMTEDLTENLSKILTVYGHKRETIIELDD